MARIVALIGRTESGFIDPVSGVKLSCVGDGSNIERLLNTYTDLRSGDGVLRLGKSEVKLTGLVCMATNVAGGEMKARVSYEARRAAKAEVKK